VEVDVLVVVDVVTVVVIIPTKSIDQIYQERNCLLNQRFKAEEFFFDYSKLTGTTE
jgi:hypothetical protein